MLSNIRENSSGVLAWIVAILIIIAMAFFGLSSYVGHEPTPVIAKVGDRSINQLQFRGEFDQWKRMMRQRMGQNSTLDLDSDSFKQNTLDRMINREIVAGLAEKQGYTVSDEQVANSILTNPQFQLDGEFSQETYDSYVSSVARSKSDYEDQVRQRLSVSQVISGFGDSGFSLGNTVTELSGLQAQKRTFDLVSFKVDDLAKGVELTDEQIQAYYDENIDDYLEDDRMSVSYVRLSAKDLEGEVTVSDEDLQVIYDENQESYLTEETRNVRHILFTGDNALEDATSTLDKLNVGGDFAALAKELSQDPGSGANGGDLGVVERGQMVKPFEDKSFELEQGVVSEPVQSRFGYHLIEVTGINSPEIPAFADVKEDLRKEQLKALSEEIFFERLEQLKNIVYENPESLDVAADELSLKVQKTSLFSRTKGNGLTNNPAIRDAAFSDSVFVDNNNSDVIEISATEVVALRKEDFVASKPKVLQQVRAQVSNTLKSAKAKELAVSESEGIFAKLAEGDWNAVLKAAELEAEEQTVSYATSAAGIDRKVIDDVFLASVGGSTQSGRVEAGNGDYYIYKLTSVDEESNIEQSVTDSVERLLQSDSGNALVAKYLEYQREKLGVKVDATAF